MIKKGPPFLMRIMAPVRDEPYSALFRRVTDMVSANRRHPEARANVALKTIRRRRENSGEPPDHREFHREQDRSSA
jgi:hypothetical protein